ncbi:MAG TPA: SPASM domain-containing protein [Terriglobia bacterium]|nr:SPASM domain-containing protein [Terriglobia bacterium]
MFGSAAVISTTGTDSLFLPEADDLADPLPGILWIELTSKCPFDCVFCSRQLRRGTGEHMDFRLFQALIGQLDRPGIIRLNYSGESTHYPHLEEAVKLAKSTGALTELVSAFASISQKTLSGLVDSGLDRLSLSVHTMDVQQYQEIYRHGSLELLKSRVQELLHLKQQRGTQLPKLDFAFVAMERNLSQLLPVAGYAREAGVTQIFVHPVIRRDPVPEPFSEELSGNRLREQFRQELTKAVASAQQKHPEITFTFCNPQVSREPRLSSVPQAFSGSLPQGARISTCEQSPWDSVHILANGDVMVCEVMDKVPLGNLREQTLHEIWKGPGYREFRRRYVQGAVPECRECPWKVAYFPGPTRSCFDAAQGMSPQLLRGWHLLQNETIAWSKGESLLWLKGVAGGKEVRIRGILPHSADGQGNCLELHANAALLGTLRNNSSAFAEVDHSFGYTSHQGDIVRLRLTTRSVYRPSLHGLNNDNRDLGFGLLHVEVL